VYAAFPTRLWKACLVALVMVALNAAVAVVVGAAWAAVAR
jgi:hypothetical protein